MKYIIFFGLFFGVHFIALSQGQYKFRLKGVKSDVKQNFAILKNGDSIPFKSLIFRGKDVVNLELLNKKGKEKLPLEVIDRLYWNQNWHNVANDEEEYNTWRFIKHKRKNLLVGELVKGNCSVYMRFPRTQEFYSFEIYLQREGEESATKIHKSTMTGTKFKVKAPKYFQDCPEVATLLRKSKVSSRLEFIQLELAKIINIYNATCASQQ